MGLVDRLNRLDNRVFGLRRPSETAEDYLRRLSARRPNAKNLLDLQQALREHFSALDAERAGR